MNGAPGSVADASLRGILLDFAQSRHNLLGVRVILPLVFQQCHEAAIRVKGPTNAW